MPITLLLVAFVFVFLHFDGVRFTAFGIPVYAVELGTISILAAALIYFRNKRDRRKLPLSVTISIGTLLFGVATSLISARLPSAPCPLSAEKISHAIGIVKSWFAFPILFGYALFLLPKKFATQKCLLELFLVSSIPFAIASTLYWIFGTGATYDHRLQGIYNSPNTFALHIIPACIVSWTLLRFHLKKMLVANRDINASSQNSNTLLVSLTFCFSLFFSLLLFSKSTSALASLVVSMIFLELALRPENIFQSKIFLKTALFFLLTVLVICSFLIARSSLLDYFNPSSRSSFASRLMIWRSASAMIADSPFFGIGPGNFGSCYLSYQQYFPPYLEWSAPQPHNVFLAFWLESGLIGLLSLAALLLVWFRKLLLLSKKDARPASLALIAIMIATIIHGFFDTPYWQTGLAYIFWIVYFLGLRSCVPTEGQSPIR